jgi:predicted DNA-binding antitoxin AbrB/MazE fold protein
MSDSFDAVYENGVFRPLESVDLVDGLRVRLTMSHPAGPLTDEQVQALIRLGQRVYEGLSDAQIAEIEASFVSPV